MTALQVLLIGGWSGVFAAFGFAFLGPEEDFRANFFAGVLASFGAALASTIAVGTGLIG